MAFPTLSRNLPPKERGGELEHVCRPALGHVFGLEIVWRRRDVLPAATPLGGANIELEGNKEGGGEKNGEIVWLG